VAEEREQRQATTRMLGELNKLHPSLAKRIASSPLNKLHPSLAKRIASSPHLG
jgi:hypothetical protein